MPIFLLVGFYNSKMPNVRKTPRKGDNGVFSKIDSRLSSGGTCWNSVKLHNSQCEQLIPTFRDGISESLNLCKSRPQCKPFLDLDLNKLKEFIPFIPEEKGCQQLVIGPFELLAPYITYMSKNRDGPFFILMAKHWTPDLNKILISCGMEGSVNNTQCLFPVRLLIPKNLNELYNNNITPRITMLEFCIVLEYMHNFESFYYDQPDLAFDIIFLKPKITQ